MSLCKLMHRLEAEIFIPENEPVDSETGFDGLAERSSIWIEGKNSARKYQLGFVEVRSFDFDHYVRC